MTTSFDEYLTGIYVMAPKPTTFRINLRNDENFYLIWMQRSWVAQVEGKKYYLLNLNEQENAEQAIARMLRYGAPNTSGSQDPSEFDTGSTGGDFPGGDDTGGGEDVDYRIRCAIKGYDVNFLIDSYLLHFHGKSTWGIETRKQTEERNKKYKDIFLKKWGHDMTQIFILRKDFENILKKENLEDLFKKGKFGELIRKLYK